jgi:hypothetical protein
MRFILVKIAEVALFLLGLICYPIAYFIGANNKHINLSAQEEAGKQNWWVNFWAGHDENSWFDRWFGLYELKHYTTEEQKTNWYLNSSALKRFLFSYWWGAFRNFAWGGRKTIQRFLVGTKTDIKTKGGGRDYKEGSLRWMNKQWHGWQWATFKVNGKKTFRFSFTISLFGLYWNVMLGAGEDRYIAKNRGFWGYFILLMLTAALILVGL